MSSNLSIWLSIERANTFLACRHPSVLCARRTLERRQCARMALGFMMILTLRSLLQPSSRPLVASLAAFGNRAPFHTSSSCEEAARFKPVEGANHTKELSKSAATPGLPRPWSGPDFVRWPTVDLQEGRSVPSGREGQQEHCEAGCVKPPTHATQSGCMV